MTRRQKYRLLRWAEETLGGLAVGCFLSMWVADAFLIDKTPVAIFAMACAVLIALSTHCGYKAQRMRRRRRK